MSEKWPSSSSMRSVGFLWLIVSVVLALAWSYYSSEWWSIAPGVLAVFFFVESIAHMNVYAILGDLISELRKREPKESVE